MENELTKRIISVAEDYLGPSAERFIARQITTHLNIEVGAFSVDKLGELSQWVELSASLLIEKAKAKELAEKILTLG